MEDNNLGGRVSYAQGEVEEYNKTKQDIEILRIALAFQCDNLKTTIDALNMLLEKFQSIAQMSNKALEKCGEISAKL